MPIMVDVENATLVHIAANLENDGPYKYKIGMFPKRHGETAAFERTGAGAPRLERPFEVVWVGHGLAGGMKILVQAKKPGSGNMKQDLFELTAANPAVSSTQVKLNGKPTAHWTYAVRLMDAAGNDLANPIDPDVIINPNP